MSGEMAQSKKCLSCKDKGWSLAHSLGTRERETLEHSVLHGTSPSDSFTHSSGNPIEEKVERLLRDIEDVGHQGNKAFCTHQGSHARTHTHEHTETAAARTGPAQDQARWGPRAERRGRRKPHPRSRSDCQLITAHRGRIRFPQWNPIEYTVYKLHLMANPMPSRWPTQNKLGGSFGGILLIFSFYFCFVSQCFV